MQTHCARSPESIYDRLFLLKQEAGWKVAKRHSETQYKDRFASNGENKAGVLCPASRNRNQAKVIGAAGAPGPPEMKPRLKKQRNSFCAGQTDFPRPTYLQALESASMEVTNC